jgi:hypothetical protein
MIQSLPNILSGCCLMTCINTHIYTHTHTNKHSMDPQVCHRDSRICNKS